MDWLTKLLMAVDAVSMQVSRKLKRDADDYYQTIAPLDHHVMKMRDGGMISFFKLNGFSRTLSRAEQLNAARSIESELVGFFGTGKKGHALQIVDVSDEGITRRRVLNSMQASLDELKASGLGASVFTDDYVDFVCKNSVWKDQYLVVMTLPDAVTSIKSKPSKEQKKQEADKADAIKHLFKVRGEEHAVWLSPLEKDTMALHTSFSKSVMQAMASEGAIIEQMDVADALIAQKESLYGGRVPDNWEPSLSHLNIVKQEQKTSQSAVRYEAVDMVEQIIDEGGSKENLPNDIFQFGGRYVTTLSMVKPQAKESALKTYKDLVAKIPKEVGYMGSFRLESDPFSSRAFMVERNYARLSSVLPLTDNLKIKDAQDQIETLHKDDDASFVFMQMSLVLHADDLETLQRNKEMIKGVLASWGGAKFRASEVDSAQGLFDTAPGVSNRSNHKQVFERLGDALHQSPLFLDGVAYRSGYLHFLTDMGQPYPYEMHASINVNFNTYICGEPGSGKSTLLSLLVLAMLAKPKVNPKLSGEWPLVFDIDFGKTSFGIKETIMHAVGEDKKHLFVAHEMGMDKNSAINPHDLPFGRTMPTERHKTVLARFLTVLLCGVKKEPGSGNYFVPNEELEAMIKYLLPMVYVMRSEDEMPRMFDDGEFRHKSTMAFMEKHKIQASPSESYYSLSDQVMAADPKRGVRHAMLLRRYAMPRLSDYSMLLSERDEIRSRYESQILPNRLSMLQFFLQQMSSVLSEYQCFNRVTKVNLDMARLISIDIKKVCGEDNTRKAVFGSMGLMTYMVKRENTEESPDLLEGVSELYLPYLKRLDLMNRSLPSNLDIEEAHVLIELFESSLNDSQRQNRKAGWGLTTLSQNLEDPPAEFFSLCSAVFVSSKQDGDVNAARFKKMNLSAQEQYMMTSDLRVNRREFFLQVNTTSGDIERVANRLRASFPPALIWSSNSNTTDRNFKNDAISRLGFDVALARLSAFFPGGVRRYFDGAGKERLEKLARKRNIESVYELLMSELAAGDVPSADLKRLI
jgi:hypothetical protein